MPTTQAEFIEVVFADPVKSDFTNHFRSVNIASTTIALTIAAVPIAFRYNSGSGTRYFLTPSQSIMINALSPIAPMARLSKP